MTPFKPYNPSEWTSASFGFPTAASVAGRGLEDVEMRNGDSPARPFETAKDNGAVQKEGKENRSDEGKTRPMAGGAVARVRRKRQKTWGKGRSRGSDSEGDVELQVRVLLESLSFH